MRAMAQHKQPEPTPEQLQAAVRRLARRGRFSTLEEALADPIWRNVVRGMAGAMAARQMRAEQAAQAQRDNPPPRLPPVVTPPRPSARPVAAHHPQRQLFDPRRAAANDLEDDDDE